MAQSEAEGSFPRMFDRMLLASPAHDRNLPFRIRMRADTQINRVQCISEVILDEGMVCYVWNLAWGPLPDAMHQ